MNAFSEAHLRTEANDYYGSIPDGMAEIRRPAAYGQKRSLDMDAQPANSGGSFMRYVSVLTQPPSPASSGDT